MDFFRTRTRTEHETNFDPRTQNRTQKKFYCSLIPGLKIERVSHSEKMFFVIGLSETDLANEIKLNDDIIIGDFEDTYENLAFKTLLGYQFSIHYCPSGLVFEMFTEF